MILQPSMICCFLCHTPSDGYAHISLVFLNYVGRFMLEWMFLSLLVDSCVLIDFYVSFRRKVLTAVRASGRVDKFSKSDIIVSPSILSANFASLGEQVTWKL